MGREEDQSQQDYHSCRLECRELQPQVALATYSSTRFGPRYARKDWVLRRSWDLLVNIINLEKNIVGTQLTTVRMFVHNLSMISNDKTFHGSLVDVQARTDIILDPHFVSLMDHREDSTYSFYPQNIQRRPHKRTKNENGTAACCASSLDQSDTRIPSRVAAWSSWLIHWPRSNRPDTIPKEYILGCSSVPWDNLTIVGIIMIRRTWICLVPSLKCQFSRVWQITGVCTLACTRSCM